MDEEHPFEPPEFKAGLVFPEWQESPKQVVGEATEEIERAWVQFGPDWRRGFNRTGQPLPEELERAPLPLQWRAEATGYAPALRRLLVLQELVETFGTEAAPCGFMRPRSCEHEGTDRRCLACGLRLCAACGETCYPGEPEQPPRCPQCQGPVWEDAAELPPETTNPDNGGY